MAELTPAHRFVDPGLNYLFTNNYDLAIRILPDGFSYMVVDTIKDRVIAIEEYSSPASSNHLSQFGADLYIEWLNRIRNQCYLLKEKFNKVRILSGGNKYTLMPPPLFDPDHAKKYIAFNHPLNDGDEVLHDNLKSPESVLICAIPASLQSWITKYYPGSRIFHNCGSLLRNFYLQLRGGNTQAGILANIQTEVLDIIIFTGTDFRFCNSFRYTAQTDLLYYLLFVMEQLKIKTEESTLFLSGSFDGDTALLHLLKTYISSVEVVPLVRERNLSPVFDHAPLHRYYDLLSVSLCG